jgi:predicted Zn-ribbon and HTH transcriptional regulator
MTACNIRQIWDFSYEDYCMSGHQQSDVQKKASRAILSCKTGKLGVNMSSCPDCGYTEVHNNSCRNRNCPNCQAVKKELWVDSRRSEVIDSSYFHVVFTLPHELNSLIYCNQKHSTRCSTNAAVRPFWNFLPTRNILVPSLVSYRCFTHGIRN